MSPSGPRSGRRVSRAVLGIARGIDASDGSGPCSGSTSAVVGSEPPGSVAPSVESKQASCARETSGPRWAADRVSGSSSARQTWQSTQQSSWSKRTPNIGWALTNCAESKPTGAPHISQARPARLNALALTMSVYRTASLPSSVAPGRKSSATRKRVTIRSRITRQLTADLVPLRTRRPRDAAFLDLDFVQEFGRCQAKSAA
jgi:hypothetical protein